MSLRQGHLPFPARWLAALACAAMAVGFTVSFVGLRGRDFTKVDGGLLPLVVFQCGEAPVAVANHALEFEVAALWSTLVETVAGPASGPEAFLLRHALLNALAGGLVSGMLAWLVARSTGSLLSGVLAGSLAGSSRAFLLHSTHASQVMPAVLLAMLTLFVVFEGAPTRPFAARFLAGGIFAVAVAVYLPVLLAAPALGVLWRGDGQREGRRDRLRNASGLVVGFCAGIVAMLPRLLELGSSRLAPRVDAGAAFLSWWTFWADANPRSWLQAPLGLASSIWNILPADFSGLRSLRRGTGGIGAWLALVGAIVALLAVVQAIRFLRPPRPEDENRTPDRLPGASVALLGFGAVGPLLVSVYYEKLWLLPVIGLAALVAMGIHAGRNAQRRLSRVVVVAWFALSGGAWVGAWREAGGETPHLGRVRSILDATGPRAVVLTSWDPVSVLYQGWSLCREDRTTLSVPGVLSIAGQTGAHDLRRAVIDAGEQGRPVFALGLLDSSGRLALGGVAERAGVASAALAWLETAATAGEVGDPGAGEVTLFRLRAGRGPAP